jgi:hypothetical protein
MDFNEIWLTNYVTGEVFVWYIAVILDLSYFSDMVLWPIMWCFGVFLLVEWLSHKKNLDVITRN